MEAMVACRRTQWGLPSFIVLATHMSEASEKDCEVVRGRRERERGVLTANTTSRTQTRLKVGSTPNAARRAPSPRGQGSLEQWDNSHTLSAILTVSLLQPI